MSADLLPTVSIMIPTYNQAKFLADAVDSALSQDYPRLEVLVADDCSSDETPQVVERWAAEPRFRYVRRPVNLGRVGNYRETLYHDVRGRWVLNLDGDDHLCDPGYISTAVERLRQDARIALVFANQYHEFDGVRAPGLVQRHPPVLDGTEVVMGYAAIYWRRRRPLVFIPHATALYDVELARSLDFYRADILSADLESLLRLIVGRKIAFIERHVACWRLHGSNATSRPNPAVLLSNFALIDGVYGHLNERAQVPSRRLRKWRNEMARAKFVNDAEQIITSGQGGALPSFTARVCQRYPSVAVSVMSPAIMRAMAATTAKRLLARLGLAHWPAAAVRGKLDGV